jgi:hypothetical protein
MNGQFYGLYNDTKDNALIPREFPLTEFHTSGYYKIPFGAKILSIFAIGGGASGQVGDVRGSGTLANGGLCGNPSGFTYFEFLVEDLKEGNSLYIEIGAGATSNYSDGNATSVFLDNRSGILLLRINGGRTGSSTINYTTKVWQYTQFDSIDLVGNRSASPTGTLEIDAWGDCAGFTSGLPGGSISTGNTPFNGASLVVGSTNDNDWILPPNIQNYTSGGKPILICGGINTGDKNGQNAETVPVFTYSVGFPGGGGAASINSNGGNGGRGYKGSGGGGGGAARTGFSGGSGGAGGNGYVAIYPIF